MFNISHWLLILCAGKHLRPFGFHGLHNTNSWLSCLVSCSILTYMQGKFLPCLSFLICKMGRVTVSSLLGYVKA